MGTHLNHPRRVASKEYPQHMFSWSKEERYQYFLVERLRPRAMAIGLDKSGYQVNNFLISHQKHMLWVLIRSASARRF